MADEQTIADFSATLPDGTTANLSDKAGKVLLVVNTASKCGFTPQYAGLEDLWRKYRDRGFEILAFPCNQFRHQEPGSAEEIASFCALTYDVTFPIFAKIEVNGADADPLYNYIKRIKPGVLGTKRIKWNFTKFLVNRDGATVARFAPTVKPEEMEGEIEKLLG